jgi:hypothetical protein
MTLTSTLRCRGCDRAEARRVLVLGQGGLARGGLDAVRGAIDALCCAIASPILLLDPSKCTDTCSLLTVGFAVQ